jgi:hypothetical protein
MIFWEGLLRRKLLERNLMRGEFSRENKRTQKNVQDGGIEWDLRGWPQKSASAVARLDSVPKVAVLKFHVPRGAWWERREGVIHIGTSK